MAQWLNALAVLSKSPGVQFSAPTWDGEAACNHLEFQAQRRLSPLFSTDTCTTFATHMVARTYIIKNKIQKF